MKQKELFEGLKPPRPTGQGSPTVFDRTLPDERFELRLSTDKIIFSLIAFLILLVVVFTIGVEHGKKVAKTMLREERSVESITNLARLAESKQAGIRKDRIERGKYLNQEIERIENPDVAVSTPKVKSTASKASLLEKLLLKSKKDSKAKQTKPSEPLPGPEEIIKAISPQSVPVKETAPPPPPPAAVTVNIENPEVVIPETPKPEKGSWFQFFSFSQKKTERSTHETFEQTAGEPPQTTVVTQKKEETIQHENGVTETKTEIETTKTETYGKTKASYEVRVMSVAEESFAKREVGKLTKQEVLASARKSGNYFMIILGPFPDRKQADEALERARKVSPFKDAYIRKLTS